jgi:hypothetical protein
MRVGPGGAMVVSAAIVVRRARRMKEMCAGSRLIFFGDPTCVPRRIKGACAREWRDGLHDGGSMRVEAIGVEMRHSLKERHGGCFER